MKPFPLQLLTTFIMVLALFPSSLASGGGQSDDIPDLMIEELRVDAGVDSYEITVIIHNFGTVSSGNVMGSFTVEEDISTGRYDLISDFSVPGIASGGHYNVTQRWVPSSTGFHRISAVIDVDGEGSEIFRYNDIDVVEVYIPNSIDVYPSLDGNPDPDVIGNFFSGVTLPVDFTVRLPDVGDMDLVDHVQIELDGVGRFAQLTADGSFSTSFDLGAYSPGDHILSVNASVAGIPLPVESRTVRIYPLPSWIGASSTSHLAFNSSLEAYELTGFLEVPSCVFSPSVDGLEGFNDLVLFDGPADIMVDGYVLLDGTTTLDIQGELRVKYGDVPWATSFKVRSYLPSPDGPARIGLSSSSRMTIESGTLRFDPLTALGLPSNETVVLPIEHALEGDITLDGTLELSDGSFPPGIEMSVKMEMEGQRSHSFNSRELGLNQPVLSLDSTLLWKSLHELESGGSGWTSSGGVTWAVDHTLFDMGIVEGDQDIDPYIVIRGGEYQLEMAGDDGNWGFVSISGRTGTVSSITYREGSSEVEVRSNNLYKSDPQLVYINGSVPLVAWVESSSYSTDMVTRSNSRRLMYSLGEDLHGGFSEGLNITGGSHMDSQPDLASSPDGGEAAIVWKRDGDGDPLTSSDARIMISTFNWSSWSEPKVISGGGGSCEPTVAYTSSGDLWVAWEEQNGTLSTKYIENTTGVLSGIRSITGPDGSLLGSPVLDRGDGEHPVISYIVVTEDGWGDMYPAVKRGDKARNTLWDDERRVGLAMPWVQSLSIVSDDAGIFMIWKGPDGTIWASGGNRSDPGGKWGDPIDLVADGISGVSSDLMVDRDNNFLMGHIDPDVGAISVVKHNLSRRGEAVSIVSPNATVSGPGDTIYVEMRVQNTGLFPRGEVMATFLATVRDPITGEYSDVHLNSVPITFSEVNEVVLWERYHTVLQYEIGLSLVVTSPGMERTSSRFVSVSAFPGLEVRSIDTVGDIDPGENVTISLLVRNRGNAPSGTRTVSVMGAHLSTPLTFQGNAKEPLFLRGNLSGEILLQRDVSIDKGESKLIQFEMEVPFGTTYVWGVIEPLPWEGLSGMGSPAIQISKGSDLEVQCDARHIAIEKGESTSVDILGKEAEWVRVRMLDVPYINGLIPEELGPLDKGNTLRVWLTNGTGSTIWEEDLPANNLSLNGAVELELPTDRLDPGEYQVHILQPYSGNSLSSSHVIDVEISIISPGSADIDVDERTLKGSLKGRYVNANLTWNGNRTIRAMLVTVYNGLPRDGIVISETIVLGMEGGETRTVELGVPVDEGYYLLSFQVSYPDPVGYTGPSDMKLIGYAQIGMFVKDPPQIDRVREESINEEDIIPSLAMSLVMICVVFGLAIPLKARKKRDEDD